MVWHSALSELPNTHMLRQLLVYEPTGTPACTPGATVQAKVPSRLAISLPELHWFTPTSWLEFQSPDVVWQLAYKVVVFELSIQAQAKRQLF
jgi:hypothetical protein